MEVRLLEIDSSSEVIPMDLNKVLRNSSKISRVPKNFVDNSTIRNTCISTVFESKWTTGEGSNVTDVTGSYTQTSFTEDGNVIKADLASVLSDNFIGTYENAGAVSANDDWTAGWVRAN